MTIEAAAAVTDFFQSKYSMTGSIHGIARLIPSLILPLPLPFELGAATYYTFQVVRHPDKHDLNHSSRFSLFGHDYFLALRHYRWSSGIAILRPPLSN
jgi:hypothetical protein